MTTNILLTLIAVLLAVRIVLQVRQGKTENIHGYAALLYITAQQLTQEQGFCDDITRSVQKWQRRMEKQAEKAAKSVTEHEELASQSLMSDLAAYSDATPKERKQMRKQWKEDAREAIKEEMI